MGTYDQEVVAHWPHRINGLVQERCSCSALAMELRLSCTKPSIYEPHKGNTDHPAIHHGWSIGGSGIFYFGQHCLINDRADSRFVPSQWETSLQSNAVSHWLGADLESALNDDIAQGPIHASPGIDYAIVCIYTRLPDLSKYYGGNSPSN